MLQIQTIYPNALQLKYDGSSAKSDTEDLMIQFIRDNGDASFDIHKSKMHSSLCEYFSDHPNQLENIACAALPARPVRNSLATSEKIVQKVIASYSPKKKKKLNTEENIPGVSHTLKSFFAVNKVISTNAMSMVRGHRGL